MLMFFFLKKSKVDSRASRLITVRSETRDYSLLSA